LLARTAGVGVFAVVQQCQEQNWNSVHPEIFKLSDLNKIFYSIIAENLAVEF